MQRRGIWQGVLLLHEASLNPCAGRVCVMLRYAVCVCVMFLCYVTTDAKPSSSAAAAAPAPAATASSSSSAGGSSFPAHEVLKMPALSPTMMQGNIVSWNKKVLISGVWMWGRGLLS